MFTKSVGDWVRLKGKTRHGKNIIKIHGEQWLITECRGESPAMPEAVRLLIRSEKKTNVRDNILSMIPDYDLRWINVDPIEKDFEVQ